MKKEAINYVVLAKIIENGNKTFITENYRGKFIEGMILIISVTDLLPFDRMILESRIREILKNDVDNKI